MFNVVLLAMLFWHAISNSWGPAFFGHNIDGSRRIMNATLRKCKQS